MRKLLGLIVAAFVAAAGGEAHAKWHEAQSKHFIIYANQNPERLRQFAARLEKFDRTVRTARKMSDPPVGDGNRLTVFVMPQESAVQKLAGDKSGFVKGFYIPRVTGSVAFVADLPKTAVEWDLEAETIFFHEYAHHLMMQELDRPYPEWLIEGFAELVSTAKFERDGAVLLGASPRHRAWGLLEGVALPLEQLLTGSYSKISAAQRESIYGHGWLLTHLLTFEPKRQGQLGRYVAGMAKGVAPLDAARAAFGDLKLLEREMKVYVRRSSLAAVRLKGPDLEPDPIAVKPLSEGAAQVIMLRATSKRGVNEKTAEPVAAQVRKVQARFPGDELVEITLAEAELDAGHVERAEAAADRASKANPRSTEALVYKGRAIAARAENADGAERSRLFARAREVFIAANKIDPEDPEPLHEFYKTFVQQGVRPNANAIAALHYASNLAPQDLGVRMSSAFAYLNEGKLKEARTTLAPIAYSPHGGSFAEDARKMIAKIDAGDAAGAMAAAAASASSPASDPR